MSRSTTVASVSLSRRNVLKAAGAAAAVGTLSLARSAHAAGSDVLKIGLIGCGGRGSGAAMQMLKVDEGTQLVAAADIFGDKSQRFRDAAKAKYGERVACPDDRCGSGFAGYKAVIQSDAAIVLIACASKFHPYYLKAAIDAGKHVFVEKPHGIDPVGVRLVAEASKLAQARKLSIVSGLQRRYDPGVQETMKRIHDGEIGEVVSMEGNFLRAPYQTVRRNSAWSELEYQCRNWYHIRWLSGDDVVQSLVHNLDVCLWALGDKTPKQAHGLAGRSASFGEVYGDMFDHHSVVYYFDNGVRMYGFCRTQAGCHGEVSEIVLGSKGKAYLHQKRIEFPGRTPWTYAGGGGNAYELEQAALARSVRQGQPINNADYMLKSTMTAVLGQLACYTGKMLDYATIAGCDFAYQPLPDDCRDDMPPPVKPDATGNYPLPYPGATKLDDLRDFDGTRKERKEAKTGGK